MSRRELRIGDICYLYNKVYYEYVKGDRESSRTFVKQVFDGNDKGWISLKDIDYLILPAEYRAIQIPG